MALSRSLQTVTARVCAASARPLVGLSGIADARSVHTEARIKELGYTLPTPSKPAANYIMCHRVGNLIYTSGHLPMKADGELYNGKVGKDFTTEEAYEAARACALAILGTVKAEIGDLDKVKRVVKILGFVNCVGTYSAQPKVLNGASDLLGEVLGDRGIHARSAVGTNALPLNVPVEVEAIVEIEE